MEPKEQTGGFFELIEQFLDQDSNPVFQTEVRIEGLPAGTGTGYSKKESQQNAAQMAIKKVKDPTFMATVNENQKCSNQQWQPNLNPKWMQTLISNY